MNIVQITPGAGGMYCGNCFRDNSLVSGLRKLGHSVVMVPLYLPMTLEEADQSAGTPVFFGGVNVYLEQKSALFRSAPRWLHRLLASPKVLRWAAGRAAKTRPEDTGDLTISMLRGEEGRQAREIDELIAWLKTQPQPDLVCLSNALLVGLARRLKHALRTKVVCMLQGEDYFLDSLPGADSERAWETLVERAQDVDLFVAPSRYYGELMARRANLPIARLRVIHNGINLEGYRRDEEGGPASPVNRPPVLGYFARMCKEKGLDTLVESYLILRARDRINNLKLWIGGGCGPADEAFVGTLRERLRSRGVLQDVEFRPNLDRAEKLKFLQGLTVFSVPALYGEAFGLYVLEALASGVPAVQPRTAAFPELIERTGGGLLCEPGDPAALAETIEQLLLDPARLRASAETGRRTVFEEFSAAEMASRIAAAYQELLHAGIATASTAGTRH